MITFALRCGSGTDYPETYTFQFMLERTDAIMNVVLEPTTFVLAYPSVFKLFSSNAPTCPYGLRGLPSWAWQKCNRLLRLGRP